MERKTARGTQPGWFDRIRFAVELLIVRGLRYRLLLAALIVAVVALLAGLVAALFDAGSGDIGANVWWAFLRLTDPGYLGDDEGVARRTISTVVTVLGYVVFLGLLIAILTQWLDRLITKLESGVSPVALADHVLILGLTHRTPTIVTELLQTRNRVQRFLESRGAERLRIVILSEHVDAGVQMDLREHVGPLWSDRQVYLRSGTPLRVDHLERVAYLDAGVLIIPGGDFAEKRPQSVDAQTVKTLMAVSEHAAAARATPPLAVAELHDGSRLPVALEAYSGPCEVLAADDMISRIIAQSVRQRGLCRVFTELLTLNLGNALFVRQIDGQAGRTFDSLRYVFPRAVLLGTVRSGDQTPSLNPDADAVLREDDYCVFIARRYHDCVPVESAESTATVEEIPRVPAMPRALRVLILGWSRKVPALLEEFDAYGGEAVEIDIVSSTPLEERERTFQGHDTSQYRARLRQVVAGYTTPGVLEELQPNRYDNVILLASERLHEEDQADATTVLAYLMLRNLLAADDSRPRVFVEILDDENEFLFQRHDTDAVVSPTLVSHLMSQVALRRELGTVFSELSRSWGAQIVLEGARGYMGGDGPFRFRDLDRVAAARGEIALGLHFPDDDEEPLALNPDRDRQFDLGPDDEVVVLRTYAERSQPAQAIPADESPGNTSAQS